MIAEIDEAIRLIGDIDTCLLGIHCENAAIAMGYNRKMLVKLTKIKEQIERKEGVKHG